MDGDFMEELNIAFIGINYRIGGNYPTHYGICYHFYNVQEEKDIDHVALGYDMYFLMDNTEDNALGKRVLLKLKNEEFVLSNIESIYSKYIEIPKKYSMEYEGLALDDDYVSKVLVHFIYPMVMPGLICMDYVDIKNLFLNKTKIIFHKYDKEIDLDSIDKDASLYIVISDTKYEITLNDVSSIISKIKERGNENVVYSTMSGVDITNKYIIYMYEGV